MILEVGTVLYSDARWGIGMGRHIIDRVTAKRAYSGKTEFDKEQSREIGFHAR